MEVVKCWKIAEFPKFQLKWKIKKEFHEAQTVRKSKEIISPFILLRPWNENFDN